MQRVSVDLSDLDIHHLDVQPREEDDAIDVGLQATINGIDESTIATLAGNSLRPEKLVVSVSSPVDDDEVRSSDSRE